MAKKCKRCAGSGQVSVVDQNTRAHWGLWGIAGFFCLLGVGCVGIGASPGFGLSVFLLGTGFFGVLYVSRSRKCPECHGDGKG
jgi:hypothetical protein